MTEYANTPGRFLKKIGHERCGSSDALALYEQEDGRVTGFCFSCGQYESNPLQDNPVPADIQGTAEHGSVEHIAQYGFQAMGERNLRRESLEHFGIRSEVSTTDGTTVVAQYYPYYDGSGTITCYKVRRLPKDIYAIGRGGTQLFGQPQARMAGARKLFITEGELDAVALYQALKDQAIGTKWAHLEPSVVSICHGSGSAVKDIGRNMDFVRLFSEIVLVFDQDEAGQKAVSEVLRLIPEARVAVFDEKDPCDMLIKGKGRELTKAVLFDAKVVKPSSVVSVSDVYDRAIKMPEWGMTWPWPTLHKLTYGIHRKKLYGLGAGVGIGKTDWAKELQSHLVNRHGLPIGAVMLEEDVGRTLKGIAGKFVGKQFHKPDGSFTQEELGAAIKSLEGKVMLYDHFGCKDWTDIKAAIRYMVVSEGIKDIFLDPLTALVAHLSSGEANDALNSIMGELSGLVHELDFTTYYFCHLNPPQSGPPHERGGHVHEGQFTGSRAMMRWSHYLFGLERNKDPELPEQERNTSQFVLLKDREFGNVDRFPIYWNPHTGTFLEPSEVGF